MAQLPWFQIPSRSGQAHGAWPAFPTAQVAFGDDVFLLFKHPCSFLEFFLKCESIIQRLYWGTVVPE